MPLHLWGIKLDALRSVDLSRVVSTDSAVWHGSMYAGQEQKAAAAERQMSIRAYKILVNLPTYIDKVHSAVEESRRVVSQQADGRMLQQARLLLKRSGWTLEVARRRNRTYAYAVRRSGKHRERSYLCAIADLAAWLAVPQRPGPSPACAVGEQHAPEKQQTANRAGALWNDMQAQEDQ